MSPTVTHISGPSITCSGRTVQRCALCGAKLLDSRDTDCPQPTDGITTEFAVWESLRLVRFTPGPPPRYLLLDRCDVLPDDHCLSLVE